METDNDTTQTQTNAQDGAGGGAATQPDLQARFDQLTAKFHESQEQVTKLTTMVAEKLLTQGQPSQTTQPVDDFAGLIPEGASDEQKQMFQSMFGTFAKLIDKKLTGVQRTLEAQQSVTAVQKLAAKHNVSEQVANRTAELLAQWKQQGLPFNEHDAIRFAAGEAALAPSMDPRAAQTVPVFRAPNPVPATRAVEQALPANFDDMSVEEQWNIMAKRVGDKPL